MLSKRYFVRNFDAGNLLESFIISAVSAILLIRFYLHLANYPQIGGGGLHIAHMLWGGLLMMIAMFLLMSYLTKPVAKIAAILGGIGFGTFIDELGKFITSDNNYFFQPTIALIYVVFILIYLYMRAVEKIRAINKPEYVMNALEVMKEAIINDLDAEEKKRAIQYLKESKYSSDLVKRLEELFIKLELTATSAPSTLVKVRNYLHNLYLSLIRQNWFIKLLITIFALNALASLFYAIAYIGSLFEIINLQMTFNEKMELLFSSITAILVVIGVFKMRTNRAEGYKYFKYSLLVSIFLTEFFLFYREQFGALANLAIDLVSLSAISFMINEEHSGKETSIITQ